MANNPSERLSAEPKRCVICWTVPCIHGMVEPPGLREAIEQAFARLGLELAKATAELAASRQQLGDLLAVIHGDGGHYMHDHGIEKAIADAESRYLTMVDELAASRAREAALRAWITSQRISAVAGPSPEFAAMVRGGQQMLDSLTEFLDERDKQPTGEAPQAQEGE